MTRRLSTVVVQLLAPVLAVAMLLGACSSAPEPGDLVAFCSLLNGGAALSTTATKAEFDELSLVAPPDIRETITTLGTRAGDFDELLQVEPPDLEAIFRAKFDPAGDRERSTLDAYAEASCGIEVDRPPSTRWSNFVRTDYPDAGWRSVITTQFDVSTDRIVAATIVFADAPAPMGLTEDVCRAVSEFLIGDGSDTAAVRILIGTVVVLDQTPDGPCRLP